MRRPHEISCNWFDGGVVARNKTISALPYYGGKAGSSPRGVSQWIVKLLLAPSKKFIYAEPFGGMLGILLQRPKAPIEVANDLNGEIVNWFQVVRDHGEELAEKLRVTPNAELELRRSFEPTDDPIERARRFTVRLLISRNPSMKSMRVIIKGVGHTTISGQSKKILQLADRLSRVQFLCRPAEKIMERMVNESHTVIYCDPPYRDADTSPYGGLPFDRDLFTELAQQQAGAVAISGYDDEWDHLGWVRNEFETLLYAFLDDRQIRTEVLWTNYEPAKPQSDLFGGLT